MRPRHRGSGSGFYVLLYLYAVAEGERECDYNQHQGDTGQDHRSKPKQKYEFIIKFFNVYLNAFEGTKKSCK